jgi:hypothetical protein
METSEAKIAKKGTTSQERQTIIQRWRESGKSKKDFSNENNINYYTLMSWLTPPKKHKDKRTKSDLSGNQFSEIKLPPKSSESLFARIVTGKSSIELFQPVSPDFLRRILGV